MCLMCSPIFSALKRRFVKKKFQAKYIAQCIEEVKQELRQDNINVKCNAVAKLTYVSVCDGNRVHLNVWVSIEQLIG